MIYLSKVFPALSATRSLVTVCLQKLLPLALRTLGLWHRTQVSCAVLQKVFPQDGRRSHGRTTGGSSHIISDRHGFCSIDISSLSSLRRDMVGTLATCCVRVLHRGGLHIDIIAGLHARDSCDNIRCPHGHETLGPPEAAEPEDGSEGGSPCCADVDEGGSVDEDDAATEEAEVPSSKCFS